VLYTERVLFVPKAGMSLGLRGEEAAACFLMKNGYKIISRNYKNKLGEVDIIAEDGGVICFIEVKARKSNRFGLAKESVTVRKQRQIAKAAIGFLKEKGFLNRRARFDVVALDYSSFGIKLDLIRNAFDLGGNFNY